MHPDEWNVVTSISTLNQMVDGTVATNLSECLMEERWSKKPKPARNEKDTQTYSGLPRR